jgi:hypothetical protein
MQQKRATYAGQAIPPSPDTESLSRSANLPIREAPVEAPPSPMPTLASRTSAPRGQRLVVLGAVGALSIAATSLMTLRPMARTRPSAPDRLPVVADVQPSAVSQPTYSVSVGPYHESRAILQAHQRLLWLGFKPLLIRGSDGTYLRVPAPPTERAARRVAQGLKEHGYTGLVIETSQEAGHGRTKPADPKYRVDGVLVGFEGGQTKGWDAAGPVAGLRNSSLFSFQGEHSLEASLAELRPGLPGQLRFKPESVVLPQDVFNAQVLLPRAAEGRLGVRWYVVDANGKATRNTGMPLRPGQWIATSLTILPRTALPIQELGLEILAPRSTSTWSGNVYVDNVEQRRAR